MRFFLIALFCVLLFTSLPAMAGDTGSKNELSLAGGVGVGAVQSFCFFGSGCPDDQWLVYVPIDILAGYAHALSPRNQIRLNLGAQFLTHEDSIRNWIFSGELAWLFHFIKEPKVIDPYVAFGGGFPIGLHAGIGNNFHVSKKVALFVEALAGTLVIDNEVVGRAGVKFHF